MSDAQLLRAVGELAGIVAVLADVAEDASTTTRVSFTPDANAETVIGLRAELAQAHEDVALARRERDRVATDRGEDIDDLRASLRNAEESRRLAEGLLSTARTERDQMRADVLAAENRADQMQDRVGRALEIISVAGSASSYSIDGAPLDRVRSVLEGEQP